MNPGLETSNGEALREFMRRVRTNFGSRVREATLFGSLARREGGPDSDIDVLLVLDAATLDDEDAVLDIAFDVNLAFDVYISPRVLDTSAMADPVRKATPFMKAVAQDGVPI